MFYLKSCELYTWRLKSLHNGITKKLALLQKHDTIIKDQLHKRINKALDKDREEG